MKKKMKLMALLLVAVMALSMTGCGGSGAKYTVGVCQLIQHPALDAATEGFQAALKEKLGEDVAFDVQVAAGDSTSCTTITNTFAANGYQLIMANGTAALQAAYASTGQIPILGTSITDYATALDVDNWTGKTGKNVSGTSDLAPLDQQANCIKELFPDAKTVGILYCSAEANSKYQADVIAGYLKELGFTCEVYTFTDSNDVAAVTKSACEGSDVIYIPTDNTAADCTEAINNVALPAKTPVFAGEEGICAGCGVATLTIDYYDLGYETGKMAYEILANGANPGDMEIKFSPVFTKKYNEKNATELNVTIPDGYEAIKSE